MSDALDLALDIIAEDRRAIAYRPSFARALDSVMAAILLQQIIHWYGAAGKKPFYKFKQPCNHDDYRDGDSWTEELVFSRHEFDDALALIGFKITTGKSREDAPDALVYYWTDLNRKTFYEVNASGFRKMAANLYGKGQPKDTSDIPLKLENDFSSVKLQSDFTYSTQMIIKEENYAPPELSALSDVSTSLCAADAAPGDLKNTTHAKTPETDTEREDAALSVSVMAHEDPQNPLSEAPLIPPKQSPATRKPKAPKVAQPTQYGDVFAALLATAFGVLPQMVKTGVSSPVPKSTKDRCGKVAKALLRDFPDATEADVRTFATDWLATHKNMSFPLGEDSYPDHFGRWRSWKAKNATTTDRVPHPLFPVESHITCSVAEARAYTSEVAR